MSRVPLGPGLPDAPPDFSSREARRRTPDPRDLFPWLCHGCRALLIRDEPWPFERNRCPVCRRSTQRIAWAQYRYEKSFGRLGFRQALTSSSGPVVCSQCRGKTTKKMLEVSGGLCASCYKVRNAPMHDVQKRIRKVKHALARKD